MTAIKPMILAKLIAMLPPQYRAPMSKCIFYNVEARENIKLGKKYNKCLTKVIKVQYLVKKYRL